MTKILHIPTGELLTFLSSIEYDKKHESDKNYNKNDRVTELEDSFWYTRGNTASRDMVLTRLQGYCTNIDTDWCFVNDVTNKYLRDILRQGIQIPIEEFEIIYD